MRPIWCTRTCTAWLLKTKPVICHKTSIFSYKPTVHKNSEGRGIQLHREGSPIPRKHDIIDTRISVRNDAKEGKKRNGQEVKRNKGSKVVERFTDWMDGVSDWLNDWYFILASCAISWRRQCLRLYVQHRWTDDWQTVRWKRFVRVWLLQKRNNIRALSWRLRSITTEPHQDGRNFGHLTNTALETYATATSSMMGPFDHPITRSWVNWRRLFKNMVQVILNGKSGMNVERSGRGWS